MKGRRLTSKEVARLLGVSEASVKRWADGGLLPSERTAGGHRRFRPEDVARARHKGFADEGKRAGRRRAPAPPRADARTAADAAELSQATFAALTEGHIEETAALLVNSYLRGQSVAALADTVLCPALRRVGDLWRCGELSVAREHLASRAALDALHSLRRALAIAEPTGLHALCCAVEDDFHDLPVELTSLTLRGAGWEVFNLGAHTPFYSLAEACARYNPRLVCIGATVLNNLDRGARDYAELRTAARRAGAAVVLGGAGFAPVDVRPRFPAELHADGFRQLADFAAQLASGEMRAAAPRRRARKADAS
jgi:excisionase family DNA binding protein